MELTPVEAKYVERIRKNQQQWPKKRWFALAIGLGYLCISFLKFDFFYKLLSEESRAYRVTLEGVKALPEDHLAQKISTLSTLLDSSRYSLMIFTIGALLFVLSFMAGGVIIAQVILKWRGHPEQTLLLKLLDAQNQAQK